MSFTEGKVSKAKIFFFFLLRSVKILQFWGAEIYKKRQKAEISLNKCTDATLDSNVQPRWVKAGTVW